MLEQEGDQVEPASGFGQTSFLLFWSTPGRGPRGQPNMSEATGAGSGFEVENAAMKGAFAAGSSHV
jgi:hypothetical protein